MYLSCQISEKKKKEIPSAILHFPDPQIYSAACLITAQLTSVNVFS